MKTKLGLFSPCVLGSSPSTGTSNLKVLARFLLLNCEEQKGVRDSREVGRHDMKTIPGFFSSCSGLPRTGAHAVIDYWRDFYATRRVPGSYL